MTYSSYLCLAYPTNQMLSRSYSHRTWLALFSPDHCTTNFIRGMRRKYLSWHGEQDTHSRSSKYFGKLQSLGPDEDWKGLPCSWQSSTPGMYILLRIYPQVFSWLEIRYYLLVCGSASQTGSTHRRLARIVVRTNCKLWICSSKDVCILDLARNNHSIPDSEPLVIFHHCD